MQTCLHTLLSLPLLMWASHTDVLFHMILQGPHSDFSGPTSGSTACVAIIRNNQLVVANAGDSRCVISRKGQVIYHFPVFFCMIVVLIA